MKILVVSCDKYSDLFEPFHYCMEKYWPNHPEIVYVTESIKNPYYRTECLNAEWTTRVLNAASKIDDDYILMMCDDVFIRKPVNKARIDYILDTIKALPNFCSISFISEWLPRASLMIVPIEGLVNIGWRAKDIYYNTVNCNLWKKDMLLKCLEGDPVTVDKFEYDSSKFNGNYYNSINGDWPINWGRENCKRLIGLVRGKWTQECVNFFNNENYKIDFSRRGVIQGDLW